MTGAGQDDGRIKDGMGGRGMERGGRLKLETGLKKGQD